MTVKILPLPKSEIIRLTERLKARVNLMDRRSVDESQSKIITSFMNQGGVINTTGLSIPEIAEMIIG